MFKDLEMTIDFYHVDSFEGSVYLPIFRALKSVGIGYRAVIDTTNLKTMGPDYLDVEELQKFYNKNSIAWTEQPDYENPVCTTQGSEFLVPYRNKKIRLPYGPGIYPLGWGLSRKACIGFDHILVHGQYYERLIATFFSPSRIHVGGYPKYDSLFSRKIRGDEDASEGEIIEPNAKGNLLFLPTWGDSSSLRHLSKIFPELIDKFNIVLKPHHLSLKRDSALLNEFASRFSIKILNDPNSLTDAIEKADIVVCDVRSCVFVESIMADKKTIGVLQNSSDKNWLSDVSAHEVAFIADGLADLITKIALFAGADPHKDRRAAWIESRVAHRDGSASLRTAKVLQSVCSDSRSRSLETTLWKVVCRLLTKLCALGVISMRVCVGLVSRAHLLIMRLRGNF